VCGPARIDRQRDIRPRLHVCFLHSALLILGYRLFAAVDTEIECSDIQSIGRWFKCFLTAQRAHRPAAPRSCFQNVGKS
jgi:hypothetical protein